MSTEKLTGGHTVYPTPRGHGWDSLSVIIANLPPTYGDQRTIFINRDDLMQMIAMFNSAFPEWEIITGAPPSDAPPDTPPPAPDDWPPGSAEYLAKQLTLDLCARASPLLFAEIMKGRFPTVSIRGDK